MPTDTAATPEPTLLLVADDLIIPSRVREGARPLGYTVVVAATEARAQEIIAASPPRAVLVNLTARRYDPIALIRALKTNPATQTLPLLGFAGHVEKDKHAAARDAGADLVAANSSIALHLGPLLARLLSGATNSDAEEIEDGQ